MTHVHHTLKRDLTRTILLWSGAFIALLGIVFMLSFNTLEGYILDLMAEHRLNYQTREFAKHMSQQDNRSIHEESDALVQEPLISAILLVDASGELLHVSLSKQQPPQLRSKENINIGNIDAQVASHRNLHLYKRNIPGHHATLVLVLDDRPVSVAILSTTASTALLLMVLVLLSIKALHVSLRRQLVEPVNHLREAIEDNMDESAIHAIEDALPDEAAEILDAFDHLKHASDEIKAHLMDMMAVLPACFWWSEDGQTYGGITEKCSAIMGRSDEQITATRLWNWTETGAYISAHNKRLQQAIRRGDERLDFAYPIEHDGKERWYGESVTLCYDAQGNLAMAYGIISDISARKNRQHQQAEQLELLHRMETTATLVGGIAHEFNNALAGMNGNVFLIKQSTDDAQMLNRLKRIEQLIERSAAMIDSMLAFARKSQVRAEPIQLSDFLKQLQIAIFPTLPNHIQFNLNMDNIRQDDMAGQLVIRADKKKLQEVLMQLIQNACLAVEAVRDPRIAMLLDTMQAEKPLLRQHPQITSSQLVHLQVQDNGCGIPAEIASRIFDPFFTTREVGQGSGLGLSMVYGYIHQIGGAVTVESIQGAGTTFHLYLPLDATPHPDKYQDRLLRGHGEKILVVDDDQVFRESTCDVLTRMGYQPVIAWDGKEAIRLFEQYRDDIRLIFMDILMPGMTGIEASRHIRKIAPKIPIIFLTAYDRTQPLEPEVYEDNAELINKPFRISVLSQAIQAALHPDTNQNA